MDSKVLTSDRQYFAIQESFKNLVLSVGDGTKNALEIKSTGLGQELEPNTSSENNTNRRFSLRPRKRPSTSIDIIDEDEELVNIYNLENKKPKLLFNGRRKHSNLETIFEEPAVNKRDGSVSLIGKAKVKRLITFNAYVTKTKEKKRKAQIKKLSALSKCKRLNKKLSLKDFERKLDELEMRA